MRDMSNWKQTNKQKAIDEISEARRSTGTIKKKNKTKQGDERNFQDKLYSDGQYDSQRWASNKKLRRGVGIFLGGILSASIAGWVSIHITIRLKIKVLILLLLFFVFPTIIHDVIFILLIKLESLSIAPLLYTIEFLFFSFFRRLMQWIVLTTDSDAT